MNADQHRWMRLATIVSILAAIFQNNSFGAELTPPSERPPAQGVVEYANELADAELSRTPSYQWTLPFTQYVSPPIPEVMTSFIDTSRPKIRLDEDRNPSGEKSTFVQRLIELGVTSGEPKSAATTQEISNLLTGGCRLSRPTRPPAPMTLDDAVPSLSTAKEPLLERSTSFTRFIASGAAFRFSHSGWPTSEKYPRWVRIDDEDPSLAMKPTPVELLIQRGFPLGNWDSHSLRFRVAPPGKSDTSNHLAAPANAVGFTAGGFSR